MKRIKCLSIALLILHGMIQAQPGKSLVDISSIPEPSWHYTEEYTLDRPSDPGEWKMQDPGIHAAFGSINEKYLRCEVPQLIGGSSWKENGWRGERLNAQIVIWSPDTIRQVRVLTGDLVSAKGNAISSKAFSLNLIRYVLSNFPYDAMAYGCGSGSRDSAWLMPDRFEPFERFDLPGNTVRSVWLNLDIPAETPPGVYKGRLQVISGEKPVILDMSVTVQDELLPEPHDWKFRLDLWQNPWVIAWYYHVKPWSEAHKILLREHLRPYANSGGTYITTYAVHSPWSDNSYMTEETMIEWIKTREDAWKFDYSVFDEYVKLCMDEGIDRAITIYTPLPWGNRFRYLDEKTGNYIYEQWDPTGEVYRSAWNSFLTDLKAHLKAKGWFEKTYLGINENELPNTLAAIKVIKEHSSDWKITYAGNWHKELSPLLDDYSPVIESEGTPVDMKERKEKGLTTTYYVCCTPPRPNNFVFSAPSESRYMGWYSAAYGYDGFLRWAYDAWPADPVRDARHTLWPAGDCFLVYPGGNSSIRFEMLRQGISDYEKIRILIKLAEVSQSKKVKSLASELKSLLNDISSERDFSKRDFSKEKVNSTLEKGNSIISALSDELENH